MCSRYRLSIRILSIAQQVTEQLTTDYIEEGYQQRIKRAEDATRFLTAQVARAKTELEAKSKQVQELQRHYQGSLPEELEPNMAELGRLQNQLGMINQQLTTERLSPMAVGQLVPLHRSSNYRHWSLSSLHCARSLVTNIPTSASSSSKSQTSNSRFFKIVLLERKPPHAAGRGQ